MRSGVFEQVKGGILRLLQETTSLLEATRKASELNSFVFDSTFVGREYDEMLENIQHPPEDEL